METVGWIGGVLLAFCSLPQAIKTFKTKKCDDISSAFLLMWLGGEICMVIYAIVCLNANAQLLLNYLLNIVLITIIGFYKIKKIPEIKNV